MLYLSQLSPAQQGNNFVRSLAAGDAVLRLVANLGVVGSDEIARVFRPTDSVWGAEVSARTYGYLAWLYQNSERARAQFSPSSELLRTLGTPPELTNSEAARLLQGGAPRTLLGSEKTALVDVETGMRPLRADESGAVLAAHWLRCRSLATEIADRSAMVRVSRVLNRLTNEGLLAVRRGDKNDRLYALTARGAQALGGKYKATTERSWTQSAHRTLANGYLLTALCEATDAWSEGSLFSPSLLPGVLGSAGLFTHAELFAGLAGAKRGASGAVHPADGVVLTAQETSSGVEHWDVELVEAERGNKPSADFIKSLYPLRNGRSTLGHFQKTFNLGPAGVVVREFRIQKITYVMSSEEFLAPLLKACRQFVTGLKEDKLGTLVAADTLRFTGSIEGSEDLEQRRWEELLSMVEVAFCPLSAVKKSFLGVSRRFTLLELAAERNLLDIKKAF